jgi:hypothetical protein
MTQSKAIWSRQNTHISKVYKFYLKYYDGCRTTLKK